MTIRIGINGFGRIGRSLFRQCMADDRIEIVAVNDLTDNGSLSHLLKYDSVWGPLGADVSFDDESITVDGRRIRATAHKNPSDIDWSDVDIVVEATGKFRKKEAASAHLSEGGPRLVILSAPGKGVDGSFVMGVNHTDFDAEKHTVVSNASCTTNCLAPVAKVLDETFGIKSGLMTTVHAYTGGQALVDGPHKDLRRARAAAVNIVPTTTGAAKAVATVLPHLEGKLNGMAIRVPVPTGSLVDLTFVPEKPADPAAVNAALKAASEGELAGILRYTEDPIVSTDIIMEENSSVVDGLLTDQMGDQIKVIAWYDNEWGYSARMLDLIEYTAAELGLA